MTIYSQIEANLERGWRMFPCLPTKRPRVVKGRFEQGCHDATDDLDLLRDHWVQNPDDCIGIATGRGLVVIDHDDYKADAAPLPSLPETYAVTTGQGGRQYYFHTDAKIPNSAGRLGPGIDVRGEGGYVIGAQSVSVHGTYVADVWNAPVAELPASIVEKLTGGLVVGALSNDPGTFDRSGIGPAELDRLARYAGAAFDAELERLRGASEGDRNQTTFEVACCLLEIAQSPWNDLTENDAYNALMEAAPISATFPQTEALTCWDSARKTVDGKTRPLPAIADGGELLIRITGDPETLFEKGIGLRSHRAALEVTRFGPLAVDATPARNIWVYLPHGVWREDQNVVGDRMHRLLGDRCRKNHVSEVTYALQTYLADKQRPITCEPLHDFVNVRNGMLNWKTGELCRHDPAYRSTVQLPVEYDPSAKCPKFDKFLSEIMADDAIDYIWEILGYMVLNGNPLQRAFLFNGEGANGKGTLIHVMKDLLGGDANVSSVSLDEMSTDKFKVAELYGKIANMAGDIDPTYMRSTAKFKAITGEDTLTVDRKYGQPFQFQCWSVSVFSANKFWRSADTTQGYRRRWLLVPFPHTFTDIDTSLRSRLSTELEGILAGAVRGLQRLMERGNFDPPMSALDAKDAFELAGDQVREWLREDPAIESADPASGHWVTAAEAYRTYRAWSEDSGNGIVRASEWRSRMMDCGYSFRKVGTMRVYGLSIDRSLGHTLSVAHGNEKSSG